MIKAAVLGSPIEHSLSPLIHQRAYEILGVDGVYDRHEVTEETFPKFIAEALNGSWTGFSLTMPLKEVAFTSGFECDSRAVRIQSANTLIRMGDSFLATSTDVLAFDRLLGGRDFSRVAVIGSGGTARAALGALDLLTDHVTVIQRSSHRNELLRSAVAHCALEFRGMETVLDAFDLVISTVPAGASDNLAEQIRLSASQIEGTLIEVLYKPSPTALSKVWGEKGGAVLDGLDLLVEQALDQIRLMTSSSFDYAQMRESLLAYVKEHQERNS